MAVSERSASSTHVDDLAARARAGDRAAFDELAAELRPRLARFVSRRLACEADAEDVVQETLVRAYRSLDRYDPGRRFAAWLFAIGRNVASDHRTAARRRDERAAASATPPVSPANADGGALWRTARRALGDEAYRALWLRYAEDLTVDEVARQIGKTTVATRVMLFRARRKLLEE